jgi:hypothetical protein
LNEGKKHVSNFICNLTTLSYMRKRLVKKNVHQPR